MEEVKSFKFLGVFISHDLTWTMHCDYIMKKANRRLYALRYLRRCGVSAHDSVMVYCLLVRSILEYACIVFAALPQYLADSLERIQTCAFAIIIRIVISDQPCNSDFSARGFNTQKFYYYYYNYNQLTSVAVSSHIPPETFAFVAALFVDTRCTVLTRTVLAFINV